MKFILGLCAMALGSLAFWHFGDRLSSDAIGMMIGLLFGLMTAVPLTGLILALYLGRLESSDSNTSGFQPNITVNYFADPFAEVKESARQIEQKQYRVIEG